MDRGRKLNSGPRPAVAVFDLGGVLIEWNPRHLYRRLFAGEEAAMERFLSTVCTPAWNERQDAGRSVAEAVEALMPEHADKRELIEAWFRHFEEMIPGPVPGTVEVLAELREGGVPLYAITNWSHETFVTQRPRFPFLEWFRGIVVSGAEKVIKPDPRIFHILLERYAVDPATAVFIDDNESNARGATTVGMQGLHFRSAKQLREDLAACGLLPSRPPPARP
jgi:2-haloacid dehalogenase